VLAGLPWAERQLSFSGMGNRQKLQTAKNLGSHLLVSLPCLKLDKRETGHS